jgi:hypothetical protein
MPTQLSAHSVQNCPGDIRHLDPVRLDTESRRNAGLEIGNESIPRVR